jgi:hypothetical protein
MNFPRNENFRIKPREIGASENLFQPETREIGASEIYCDRKRGRLGRAKIRIAEI